MHLETSRHERIFSQIYCLLYTRQKHTQLEMGVCFFRLLVNSPPTFLVAHSIKKPSMVVFQKGSQISQQLENLKQRLNLCKKNPQKPNSTSGTAKFKNGEGLIFSPNRESENKGGKKLHFVEHVS